jgi:small subunit ribosomal protein S18
MKAPFFPAEGGPAEFTSRRDDAAQRRANRMLKKRRSYRRQKVCKFCLDKVVQVDFKDGKRLRNFITDRGKIIPRRISGNCAYHQRQLTRAIKRARSIALLPFAAELT